MAPKKKTGKRKKKVTNNEAKFLYTNEPHSENTIPEVNESHTEEALNEEEMVENGRGHDDLESQPVGEDDNGSNDTEDDYGTATDKEEETIQTQSKLKRKRGPTKMKHIAKDPNTREKVDMTDMRDFCGPGSVTLSSYVGALVREHVPYTIVDWRKVSEEIRTVLWKSVQVLF